MKNFFIFVALVCAILGLSFVFLPEIMMASWQAKDLTSSALYEGQRYGILFWGFAVIFYAIRNLPTSEYTCYILLGLAVAGFGMGILSIYGVGGTGMYFASVLELALGFAALYFMKKII